MQKGIKYIVMGSLVVIVLVVLYYMMGPTGKANKPEVKNEDTVQIAKPINPAGTYLLYNLLKKYEKTVSIKTIQTTEDNPLASLMPSTDYKGAPNLYVNISEYFYLNAVDEAFLSDFVYDGNYALISASYFNSSFTNDFFSEDEITKSYYYDTAIQVNYLHPKFKNKTDLTIVNEDLNFHGLSKYQDFLFFDDLKLNDDFIKISESYGHINCIIIPHGEGFYMVNTQPGSFSNINIARKDGKINAENIFSHFPENNVYWHQNFGKYSEYRGVPKPKRNEAPSTNSRSSPLQYIISQPALFIAFILLLVGVFFYMLIFSKRRQKIIPPIESNENSSLEFIDIVSKLYFQQKQHNKLVNHMAHIFTAFIREHYFINLTTQENKVTERISEKSGIDEDKINQILITFKSAKNKRFTEQDLIDLHVQLSYFYKHCN